MTRLIKPFAILLLFAALYVHFGCKHDPFNRFSDPDNDPGDPIVSSACHPDSVYFENHILPILVSNCTQSGCHNAQDHKDGVVLTSYASMVGTVKKATINDMKENKLMKTILDTRPDKQMPPPPQAPLTADQVNLLKKWLAQGGQNNKCDENAGGCDLQTAKFGSFIQPLVQAKCQGCHSGTSPQGNLRLTNYAEIKASALSGKFYASLMRTSNWMPLGASKLDNCSLEKIRQWITDGAPQN